MGPRGWLAKQEALRSSSRSRSHSRQQERAGVPGDIVDHYMATQQQQQQQQQSQQQNMQQSRGYNNNNSGSYGGHGHGHAQQTPQSPPGPTFFTYSMYEADSPGQSARQSQSHRASSRSRSARSASRGRSSGTATDASVNTGRGSAARSASRSRAYEYNNPSSNAYGGGYAATTSSSSGASRPTYGATLHQQMQHQMELHREEQRSVAKSKQSSSRSKSSHSRSQSRSRSSRSHSRSRSHQGRSSNNSSSRKAYGGGYATDHQGEASVYTDNTFATSHMYSTYGGVSVTPSQISGAQQHHYAEPHNSHARGGSRRQKEQRGYFDPYAAKVGGSESRSSSSSSGGSSSSSDDGSQVEVGKKLVVHYTLVRDPRSETNGSASAPYSDAYGAPMVKDEVKVKARVENANLSLIECLDIKREEEERIAKMDRVGRKMHHRTAQKQSKVYSHYVTTGIDSEDDRIDASDAIGVISSYVTAYRALHRTTSRTIHKHDRVLVTKAQGALGRAVIELATSTGAGQVFGICPAKYHSRVARWGATALDEEEFMTWSDGLLGAVDVVIDIDGTANGDISSAAALTANQTSGKLVRIFTSGPDAVTLAESATRTPKSPFSRNNGGKNKNLRRDPPHTANYDVFNDMEEDPRGFQSDLQLLFDMVSQGYVRPKKKKAIPLEGMEYIEIKFERPPLRYTSDQSSGRSLSSRNRGRRNEFADDEKSTKSGKSARSGRSRSRGRSLSRRHSEARDDDYDTRSRRSGRSGYRDNDEDERDGGRSRSKSRTRFLRGRSKSRDDGDRSVRSSRSASRSRGGGDDWDTQSARSGYSARSKSSTRSTSSKAGSIIKRSLSMGSLRRKGGKGGENNHASANGAYVEVEPWKSGYDYIQKKEHGNEYSSHLLMRDMSTQSFLLALGKNPEQTVR